MVIVHSVNKQVPPSPVFAHMVAVMKRVRELFRHVLNNALQPTMQHCLAGVNVSLQVVLERSDVDSAGLFANEISLVRHIRAKDTFGNASDDVSV